MAVSSDDAANTAVAGGAVWGRRLGTAAPLAPASLVVFSLLTHLPAQAIALVASTLLGENATTALTASVASSSGVDGVLARLAALAAPCTAAAPYPLLAAALRNLSAAWVVAAYAGAAAPTPSSDGSAPACAAALAPPLAVPATGSRQRALDAAVALGGAAPSPVGNYATASTQLWITPVAAGLGVLFVIGVGVAVVCFRRSKQRRQRRQLKRVPTTALPTPPPAPVSSSPKQQQQRAGLFHAMASARWASPSRGSRARAIAGEAASNAAVAPSPDRNALCQTGAAASAPLPAGWGEHVSRTSGRRYWRHAATGETRWDPPPPALLLPAALASHASRSASSRSADGAAASDASTSYSNPLRRSPSRRSVSSSERAAADVAPAATAPAPVRASRSPQGAASKRSASSSSADAEPVQHGASSKRALAAPPPAVEGSAAVATPRSSSRRVAAAAASPFFSAENPLRSAPSKHSASSSEPARSGAAYTAAGFPSSLPAGWVEQQSRSSGRVYWRHAETGATRWDPPPDASNAAHGGKPAHSPQRSASSRACAVADAAVFSHANPLRIEGARVASAGSPAPRASRSASSRSATAGADASAFSAENPLRRGQSGRSAASSKRAATAELPGSTGAQRTGAVAAASAPLPAGWGEHVSKSSGRRYWRHAVTGETRWDPPHQTSGR